MLCLYLCTIAIRVSAYLIYVQWNGGTVSDGIVTPRHVIRTHWHAYEPMLVSEALFAVGNVFRFVRIYVIVIYVFPFLSFFILQFCSDLLLVPNKPLLGTTSNLAGLHARGCCQILHYFCAHHILLLHWTRPTLLVGISLNIRKSPS